MNIADLRALIGSLLDYDPTSAVYEAQLDSLLNDAQARVLTDRPWDFCQREGGVQVRGDRTLSMTFTNGSTTVTGVGFPASIDPILPGSEIDGATVELLDTADVPFGGRMAWVEDSTRAHLASPYTGVSGTYSTKLKQREILLPADTATVMSVATLTGGINQPSAVLGKAERDMMGFNPELLGTPNSYVPSQGMRIGAPRNPNGIAVVAAVGQGDRTIEIYMVNTANLLTPSPSGYRAGVSGGVESGLSKVAEYTLSDTQTLEFTPETIPDKTGFYRRYYLRCPDLGIKAPVRVVSEGGVGYADAGVDTVAPTGTVTLNPDLAKTTLDSQTFQTNSIRYIPSAGVYQGFELYPHPSADQKMTIRRLITPSPMQEDQDTPLVPEAYGQIIAYAAMEQVTLKHGDAALSNVYMRKKEVLFKAMEQRYLGMPSRRIARGEAQIAGGFGWAWPQGPIKLLP